MLLFQLKHLSGKGSACSSHQPLPEEGSKSFNNTALLSTLPQRFSYAQDRAEGLCSQKSDQIQHRSCHCKQLQEKQRGSCPTTVSGQPSKQRLLNPLLKTSLEGRDFLVRRKHKHPSISRHWLAKMVTRQRKESMLVKEKKRVRNRSKQEGLFLLSLLASCLSLYIRAQPTY